MSRPSSPGGYEPVNFPHMPIDEIEVDANGEVLISSITGYSVAKTLAGQVFFRVQYLNPDLETNPRHSSS